MQTVLLVKKEKKKKAIDFELNCSCCCLQDLKCLKWMLVNYIRK